MKTDNQELELTVAISMAAAAHLGQADLVGEAMILHPLRIMLKMREQGRSHIMQMAAVLHDVVEDSTWSKESITGFFGMEVGRLIDALSRRDGESYPDYISRVVAAGPEARAIKIMDVEDNLGRIPKLYLVDAAKAARLETKYHNALKQLIVV